MSHSGKPWELSFRKSSVFPRCFHSVHFSHMTQDIHSVLDIFPPRYTVSTPAGTLKENFECAVPGHCGDTDWVHFECPEGFPERNTSWGHSKCTENSLSWEIAIKLTRKILNVTAVYWVGIWSVHYPFPCDVFVMYQVRKPHLAPSVSNVSYPIGVYCEWMLTPNHFQVVSLTQILSTPHAATDLQLTL